MRSAMTLDYAEAERAIAKAVEALRARNRAAIAVVDSNGDLVAFAKLDGLKAYAGALAINKAYTAARMRRPSREAAKLTLAWYGDPQFIGFPGGLPVLVGSECVGGVGVSGLNDEDDEAMAALAVEAMVRQ